MNILTYGTFDLLHYGHIQLLKRAADLGSTLIVGLSTDEFNGQKGKKAQQPYALRRAVLENLDFVDLVIPENGWNQKMRDVMRHDIQLLVMGDDWKSKFDHLQVNVHYLERTDGISSTELKRLLK